MGTMKIWDGTTWQLVAQNGPAGPPGVGSVTSVDGRTGAVVLTDKYVPLVPNTGWAVTAGYTQLKSLDPQTTTLAALARLTGTLIDTLKANGIILP